MGPLRGRTIIELAGVGPAPFAGMMLADMGATVIRVDRTAASDLGLPDKSPELDVLARGRRSIAIDMKSPKGVAVVDRLVQRADALIEGFRPGVLERLGLNPERLLALQPKLVVGRMTGFGQTGPLADRAGHDINYISLSGALHAIGRAGHQPTPPLNLVGDFGGGGMLLAFGLVCAMLEADRSGHGQVVDAAMVDGSATLMAMMFGFHAGGQWRDERGVNALDSGAPWYDTYETLDGKWIAVGAIERRFYDLLLQGLGLDPAVLPKQHDRKQWPQLRQVFATQFREKTRDAWTDIFAATDACVTPVLSLAEVPNHPHNAARAMMIVQADVFQPAPSPRFSRTPPVAGPIARAPGSASREILREFGFTGDDIAALEADGTVVQAMGA